MRHRYPFLALVLPAAVIAALATAPAHAKATGQGKAHPGSPSRSSQTGLDSLASQVRQTLHGSSAHHIDYRIHIGGLGSISHYPNRRSAPASNEKLFTNITLVQMLGPKFHYVTTVTGTAPVVDGTLDGDLVLNGSGDPTLSKADLHDLAKRVHRSGLHHVTGDLVVDDTRYSHTTTAPGWRSDFVPTESGTVDAFTVDGNEWRGGHAFDSDPTPDNAKLWRTDLKHEHVSVAGSTLVEAAPPTTEILASHESGSLTKIADATLTDSINFNAEMMLREAGAQLSGHGGLHSGTHAVRQMAKTLGLPLGKVYDGSGLSYDDRESPAIIEKWLVALRGLPSYDTVYGALPVSCETGTLEHRLCGKHVRGEVHAKTGTLDHISALSGYTQTKSGDVVTFSFLLSGVKDLTKANDHVDSAIALVVRKG